MLSNAYFLAKFRFDTAENEPAKKLQNLQNFIFAKFAKIANFADPNPLTLTLAVRGRWPPRRAPTASRAASVRRARRRPGAQPAGALFEARADRAEGPQARTGP